MPTLKFTTQLSCLLVMLLGPHSTAWTQSHSTHNPKLAHPKTGIKNSSGKKSPTKKPSKKQVTTGAISPSPRRSLKKQVKPFRIHNPSQRKPLFLLRVKQLREVIGILEWVSKRGWLPNLDIAQVKLIEQWLQGQIAKMAGIQWKRGLWLKIFGTNHKAESLKTWPEWLPKKYKKYRRLRRKLMQTEIVLQIPIKRTFWLSFAINQILTLAKVPYHLEKINSYDTYWLKPPVGTPGVLVLAQRYVYVRLLWPTQAIQTKQGRRALWKTLVAPSLFYKKTPLTKALQRIKKEYTDQTIFVSYTAFANLFDWFNIKLPSPIESLVSSLRLLEAYLVVGKISLSSTRWKTVQWKQAVTPSSKSDANQRSQSKKSRQSKSKAKRRHQKFKPAKPPSGLPLQNPLTRKKQSIRHVPIASKQAGRSNLRLAHQQPGPLPLISVTWPPEQSAFVGFFTSSKIKSKIPATLLPQWFPLGSIRANKGLLPSLLQRIAEPMTQKGWMFGSWLNPKQIALWTLESLMFREWMFWGEFLPHTNMKKPKQSKRRKPKKTIPTHRSKKSKPKDVLVKKRALPPRSKKIRIHAMGRWSPLAQHYLQPMFIALAKNKGPTMFGPIPTLLFSFSKSSNLLWFTWRNDYWFLSDSRVGLQQIVSKYTRKSRGQFLKTLSTDSVIYNLQANRQWNILHLRPNKIRCVLKPFLDNPVVSDLLGHIKSAEIGTLSEGNKTTHLLQVRWNPNGKSSTSKPCLLPSTSWEQFSPMILAPFQRSLIWQFFELFSQPMQHKIQPFLYQP